MSIPDPTPRPNDKDKPGKKPPKHDFPLRPDQNRGPKQKADRSHPVSGARRINRPQGR